MIWVRPARSVQKQKSRAAEEILAKLREYLDGNCEVPVEILCGFWKDQQDAITYQELREAVKAGSLDAAVFREWSQDYSNLVTSHLKPIWERAMQAGSMSQPIMQGLSFKFDTQTHGIMKWITERGAEFVTSASEEQKAAIAALLSKKMVDGHTVDELARLIRPCIGLTKGQAEANARYYDSIVAQMKKDHPRMKEESIRRKAREAAAKYAEKQHRGRAMTIAQTEMAFAYNRGADEGIRQAQAHGLMGGVKKRWCTSGDDRVCDICQAFEGMEIEMDKGFPFKGRSLFSGQDLLPPAHPRCACAVEYIETEKYVLYGIPQMEVSITGNDSFREYTDEEINSMASQTEVIASRHISVQSKWSGKVVIDDTHGMTGKLWDCDILVMHKTAPHIILHEQLHARSISYYKWEIYLQYKNIEEASVQLMTQEISKMEGIEIISSQYDEIVDALKQIGQRIGVFKSDYDFAKFIVEMPVLDRLDWLSENLYAILGKDISTTIGEYQNYADLLDMLYAKRL